jgi:hypothetical protein
MWGTLSRLVVAVWFVGMVIVGVRGLPVEGQAPTETAKFLLLISRHAPLTSDHLLRNYVGLMVANSAFPLLTRLRSIAGDATSQSLLEQRCRPHQKRTKL